MRRAMITIPLAMVGAALAGVLAGRLMQDPAARLPAREDPAPVSDSTARAGAEGDAAAATEAILKQAARTAAVAPAPLLVGNTWGIAAADIDATAWLPLNRAMVALARRHLGKPYNAFSLDRRPREQLVLDLTRFDCFLFVEQLLALVNSRDVRSQTEGVERFTDHARRLRYVDGTVDYCLRQHYFSRWAAAAEKQGYLVDLTRFLPGSTERTVPLNYLSTHAESYEPMKQQRNRDCIAALEKTLTVKQSYVPLDRVAEVLPSLRDGDIFGLVTKVKGLDVTHVGVVEVTPTGINALHAAEGNGVIESRDLAIYARRVPDVIGLMVLRPMPGVKNQFRE